MVQQPLESLLVRSWRILSGNWSIIVPGLICGLAGGLIIGLLTLAGYQADKQTAAGFGALTALASSIVWVLASIVSIAYTTGMAKAAWETGHASYADGRRAFREDAVQLFVTMIVLTLAGIVAAIFAAPTLGLSLLALVFFLIYAVPAVVVDRRSAFEALAESARVAWRNPISTLLMTVAMGALAFAALLPMVLLAMIPFLGPIFSTTLLQIVASFFALLVVGAYYAYRSPLQV
jgi:hypothetical protein